MRHLISSTLLLGGILLSGCQLGQSTQAQPEGQGFGAEDGPIAVEAAIARLGSAAIPLTLTGTSEPIQTVSLRSRAEGQLLSLAVDAGDPVQAGQAIGQVDAQLLQTSVNEATAELASRQAEVARAEAAVAEAQSRVEQTRAELRQAEADASRLQYLATEGATSAQAAELAVTNLATQQQVVRSAEQQVRSQQQAVTAAQGRVQSQAAIVAQTRERLSYATLIAPLDGVVLSKAIDPGNLVQPGGEVLQIGDFSAVKVVVQVSELDRSAIRLGQPVSVEFDAFPGETFSGRVTRISPVADSTSRLIPVDVEVANPSRQLGSGLLARVEFSTAATQRVIVPESALTVGDTAQPTVFLLDQDGDAATVTPRPVEVGDRADGRVEVLSGLNAGETFVVRSDRSLTPGQAVKLSVLSETNDQP